MQDKNETILLIVFIGLIGGATGTFGKLALKEVSPLLFLLLRFVFAAIVFVPILLKSEIEFIENKKRLVFISLFATLNATLYVFGLQFTTAIISQTLYAAGPLVAGVFSYLIIGEEMSFKKILGIIIGFFGTLIIILGPTIGFRSIWNGSLLGNSLLFVAVISFSLYTVLSKKYEREYSPISLIKYFIFTTLVIQTVLVLFSNTRNELGSLSNISLHAWLAILWVGTMSTTVYYFFYQYVIKRATPVLASTILYLQPLSGVLWAHFLIGEEVTPIFIFGGVLIFIGIGLVINQYRPKVNS